MYRALLTEFDCVPFIFQIFLPPINCSSILLFYCHSHLTFLPWATFSVSCVTWPLYFCSNAYLCLIPHNTGRSISASSHSVQSVSMFLFFRFIKVHKISPWPEFRNSLNYTYVYYILIYPYKQEMYPENHGFTAGKGTYFYLLQNLQNFSGTHTAN